MKSVSFASVRTHHTFQYDGVWYIKIPASVLNLSAMFNAVEVNDRSKGVWFNIHDTVQIA